MNTILRIEKAITKMENIIIILQQYKAVLIELNDWMVDRFGISFDQFDTNAVSYLENEVRKLTTGYETDSELKSLVFRTMSKYYRQQLSEFPKLDEFLLLLNTLVTTDTKF